ncbi:hypothetical protein Misp01_51130 [Microtetraspora sp. NBRC 13810]|uniref:SRPBCC domain-containing protein n=1 Tax=Microtetraspora sp. NBRC 13810 TaxID=3030990 RepID=UPI0024A1880C|nr:SRPBCC domain-containing protein [Microtetraspora sp. NBRC 13810]GLW09984.1 hypothetical protein Misp01_51130 [Microtetraspora sp. NBRC 13810]
MSEGLTVTASADTEIVMTRTFDAPRALVFDAFTRPELLRRWHGARGWELVVCEIDLRPGGAWRFVSRGPGGAEMGHGGVYREVAAPARIVQTETYDDWDAGEALVTTVFDERAGRTAMTSTVRYPSREIRDGVLRSPMARGAGESYDRLAGMLGETTAKGDHPMIDTSRPQENAAPAKAPAADPMPVLPGAMLLELVPVPVKDIDRAKSFYADRLGFQVDVDVRPADGIRVVQLTPPGSACSITLTEGLDVLDMPVGTLRGLHLVVSDIEQARATLIERGVDVRPVQDLGGVFYAYFADPDGNTWTLQHMPWRS